jgi:cysteine synthase A
VGDSGQVVSESRRLATETGGHFMDQFTYAERATDWRGNNNIAESIFGQMSREEHPIPSWVVCGAGTGGTSATIGRFARYQCHPTRICVVDPEGSVFYDFYRTRDAAIQGNHGSRIEGIGRPFVVPSFVPGVIDRMIRVPDVASMAGVRFLERVIGRKCGGSTGTNLYGAFLLMAEMCERGLQGSMVTLICDSGQRYLHTYYSDAWLASQGFDTQPYCDQLDRFFETGVWRPANVSAANDHAG